MCIDFPAIGGYLEDIPIDRSFMARLKLVKHILTIGTDKYAFNAADIYGNFGGSTGVVKAPENDTTEYKGKLSSDDFALAKCIKLKCRATNTNTSGVKKSRDFTVVSSFDRAKSAIANLDGKTITVSGVSGEGSASWEIKTTRIPRRRRFS